MGRRGYRLVGERGQRRDGQAELRTLLKRLASRWFFVRNVHAAREGVLLQPRWAMSLMRGPMTRAEIRRASALA